VLIAMLLYLAAMVFLAMDIYLLGTNFAEWWDFLMGLLHIHFIGFQGTGDQQLVLAISLTFYFVTSAVLIGFGGGKVVYERLGGELVYTTTLTPGRIVWGKVQLGLVIALFFGSMTLPFLTVAWLGRGLDLIEVGFTFLLAFMMTQLHYAGTLAMFSGTNSLAGAGAQVLPWFVGQVLLLFLTFLFILDGPQADGQFTFAVTILCTGVVLCVIAYLLATAQFAPEAANRMFGVRVGLTILLAVLTIGMYIILYIDPSIIASGPHGRNSWWLEWLIALFIFPFLILWLSVPYLFLVFICEPPGNVEPAAATDSQIDDCPVARISVLQRRCKCNGLVGRPDRFRHSFHVYRGLLHGSRNVQGSSCPVLWIVHVRIVVLLLLRHIAATLQAAAPLVAGPALVLGACLCAGRRDLCLTFAGSWLPFYDRLRDIYREFPLLPYPWPATNKDMTDTQYMFGGIWLGILCVIGTPWVVWKFKQFKK